jgi:hypothetical protein
MPIRNTFDAPYNWCDSRCQRCALQDTCAIARHDDRRRKRRTARDEDPDALPAVMEDVFADLRDACGMLEQLTSKRAPEPSPPRPLSLGKKQLERATLQLARCVVRLDGSGELAPALGAECLHLCTLLAGKSARVSSYIGSGDAGVWDFDAVPNLLLIELTLARLRQGLGQLDDAPTRAALTDVERLLAPLLASIGLAARAQMAALVRAGRAPSPFLIAAADDALRAIGSAQ